MIKAQHGYKIIRFQPTDDGPVMIQLAHAGEEVFCMTLGEWSELIANPVNLVPNPAVKKKIEARMDDMMGQGLIA